MHTLLLEAQKACALFLPPGIRSRDAIRMDCNYHKELPLEFDPKRLKWLHMDSFQLHSNVDSLNQSCRPNASKQLGS